MTRRIFKFIGFVLLVLSVITGYIAMSKTGIILTLTGQEAATPENLLSYDPTYMRLFLTFVITFFTFCLCEAVLFEEDPKQINKGNGEIENE